MATSKTRMKDSTVAQVNGEVVDGDGADLDPGQDVKGPAPDRLTAYEVHPSLREENGPAE